MSKIKVIIKRPDEEYGHVTNISDRLENLQKTVEGNIEVVHLGDILIICNEEGKLLNLQPNMFVGHELLVGTIIVTGKNGEDFDDVPIKFETWKKLVERWRDPK